MKQKCLVAACIFLCSCSVTTTSGGKRVTKGPSEFWAEQKQSASEAMDAVSELQKSDAAPTLNPEDSYKKASPDAMIVYELKSNWEKTHFLVDSEEVGVGRSVKVKINNHEHTVVAKPDNCVGKEEFIRPPYDTHAPLRFTFLIGECNSKSASIATSSNHQHRRR